MSVNLYAHAIKYASLFKKPQHSVRQLSLEREVPQSMFVHQFLRQFAKVQFFGGYLTDENAYYTLKLDE